MTETSGDSARGVSGILVCGSGILFRRIHESFTTQGLSPKRAETSQFGPRRLFEQAGMAARPETQMGLRR